MPLKMVKQSNLTVSEATGSFDDLVPDKLREESFKNDVPDATFT